MSRNSPFIPDRARYAEPRRGGCSLILAAIVGAVIGALATMAAVANGNAPHPQPSTPAVEFHDSDLPLPQPVAPTPGLLVQTARIP